MEELADEPSRKFVILDNFDHNPESIRPTIKGHHIKCSGDEVLITGWKVPSPEDASQIVDGEKGVSDFIPKGTRYYLPAERIKSWESGIRDDLNRLNKSSTTKASAAELGQGIGRGSIYVSHNSIWTVDPDEPILEETAHEYDQTRKQFWLIFVPASVIATLLLTSIYSWVFKYSGKRVPNSTMDILNVPKLKNVETLRTHYQLHALIMTTTVFVNLGASTMLYRLFPHSSKLCLKSIHGILGGMGALGCGIGLYFSVTARSNFKTDRPFGVHNTIGYITIGLIQVQFLFGFSFFMLPFASFSLRVQLIPIHKFLGGATFILSATTVITGVVILSRILIPLEEHVKLPTRSILLNLVGLCAVGFTMFATVLITDHRFRRRSRPELNITEEEDITELARAAAEADEDNAGL